MKKILFYSAAALLLASCAGNSGYKIDGTVDNPDMNGKYVYLFNYPANEDSTAVDSALVKDGKFSFKGETPEAKLQVLVCNGSESDQESLPQVVFVLDNAKLTAVISKTPSVNGTPENDALTKLLNNCEKLQSDFKSFSDAHSDSTALLEQKYNEMDSLTTVQEKAYLAANPNKLSSAFIFYQMRYSLSEEEQNAILDNATPEFRNIVVVQEMAEHLNILKKVAVGKKFTDFEMADTQGKMHKLSEYAGQGKLVLLDFWASWCPPCRAEMPNIVAAYKQYKSKGFEVVGVSLDEKSADWTNALKTMGMTWPQLSDLQGWKNKAAAIYGVNSIPHSVLIDAQGTIVGKDLRGPKLQEELSKRLK